jgi:hypothetical protein
VSALRQNRSDIVLLSTFLVFAGNAICALWQNNRKTSKAKRETSHLSDAGKAAPVFLTSYRSRFYIALGII